MDRREFVALIMAAGAVSAGLNVGCNTQDTVPKKTTQDTTTNTPTVGIEKTENANNTTATDGSEGKPSMANTPTNKPAVAHTSTDKPKPASTPKHQARSESPAGEYDTVCQNSKGKWVDCCYFPDGSYGPCREEDR